MIRLILIAIVALVGSFVSMPALAGWSTSTETIVVAQVDLSGIWQINPKQENFHGLTEEEIIRFWDSELEPQTDGIESTTCTFPNGQDIELSWSEKIGETVHPFPNNSIFSCIVVKKK